MLPIIKTNRKTNTISSLKITLRNNFKIIGCFIQLIYKLFKCIII